ncbi:hypothetical protein O181_075862 [Austropuccinia psidii MF-1]|uniref:Integrase catalytic domain-containing protein n=1 Tax=Austropuccinia psidii MF-1 TaxID=1389203 RepID=A0A9Q3FFS9_9BASI|nr:hypothetical protein [Austropuccinia psidii MF-1]
MDWVTALPPGGDRSYNACLVLVDRYRKTPMFLPCHKDETAMDAAIMAWNKFSIHTGLFENIISDRDTKSPQHYGKTTINCLKQIYQSPHPTTLKLVVWHEE